MSDLINDSSNKKSRLGRGLGSLLGGSGAGLENSFSTPSSTPAPAPSATPVTTNVAAKPAAPATAASTLPPEARIWQVSIDKLIPGNFQPRTHFEKAKLEELAGSIRQNGILQPIVAKRKSDGKFEIIAGERRWRAAQIAGLHQVPVILKAIGSQATLELALIENIQREDLNPIEEAEAYRRLVEEFSLTQQQVADKVGKERATVANSLRLLNLTEPARKLLVEGKISQGHAKVLLALTSPEEQTKWAKTVAEDSLSVRQLEKMVAKANHADTKKAASTTDIGNVTQRLIAGLSEELQKSLGTKVSIDYNNSRGKISIHFYSDEELTGLVERLKK